MAEKDPEAFAYGTGRGVPKEPTRATNDCLEKCIDHVDRLSPVQHQQVIEMLVAHFAVSIGQRRHAKDVLDNVRRHMAQLANDLFEGSEN